MKRPWIFLIFFVSGFCGLLYQVVWIRQAFASFGVITPVFSVVISIFMLGLGAGSLAGARWADPQRRARPALLLYALAEAIIGVGAFAVPQIFRWGEHILLAQGAMNSWSYLANSSLFIALALFPWCFCMGLTFPLMMAAIRESPAPARTSFSLLYLANTLGAAAGALLTAYVLIECIGLRASLGVAGGLNFLIAAVCFAASRAPARKMKPEPEAVTVSAVKNSPSILFLTAVVALSFEVLWTRNFTPVLGTTVYAFASIVSVYLVATWAGSFLYRRHLAQNRSFDPGRLLAAACVTSFLPIVLNAPSLGAGATGALLSFVPFCAVLGYLTPRVIDGYAQGSPEKAGKAYAINVAGCVLGPLVTSYFLLPALGARLSMLALTPFLLVLYLKVSRSLPRRIALSVNALCIGLAVASLTVGSYEERCVHRGVNDRLQRDYTATVLCCGEGWERQIVVNGTGMSRLTFVTKEMAHLPLAFHPGKPESALLICFGMGTTYRSLLSWGVKTTAVELVPSVPRMFDFFFDDAPAVLRDPNGTVVIDDGRRFLKRTREQFDIITLDPPPPVEASGSGLLYSTQFYTQVKARLAPGGVLQQWWPDGEERILQAAARSIAASFPYVRVYKGRGQNGFHFLASMTPLQAPTPKQTIARMPPAARQDIREWAPGGRLEVGVEAMLAREIPIERFCPPDRPASITDDRPYNEYYVLRRWRDRLRDQLIYVH